MSGQGWLDRLGVRHRRHVLRLDCFAVFVPEFTDGTYGTCVQCDSDKTATTYGAIAPETHDHIPVPTPIDIPEREAVTNG